MSLFLWYIINHILFLLINQQKSTKFQKSYYFYQSTELFWKKNEEKTENEGEKEEKNEETEQEKTEETEQKEKENVSIYTVCI